MVRISQNGYPRLWRFGVCTGQKVWTQGAIAGIVLAGFIVYIFYLGVFHRAAPLLLTQNEVTTLTQDSSPIYLLFRTTRIMTMHPGPERPLLPLWLYVDGLAFVKAYEIRPFYFLGRMRPRGVWFYFPVMSFFKLARIAAAGLYRSQSYLGHYFRRMRAKLGAPKAITAAAHKIARIVYLMLTTRRASRSAWKKSCRSIPPTAPDDWLRH